MSEFLDNHLKQLEIKFAGRELDVVAKLDDPVKNLLPFSCSQKAIRKCGFWVILNVRFFNQKELKLTFEGKNLVLYAKHHYRDIYGIRVQRDFIHTYEIPEHIKKETLYALWTADDYLVIIPHFSTNSSLGEDNRDVLIPVRIPEYLSPRDRLPTLLEMMEGTSSSRLQKSSASREQKLEETGDEFYVRKRSSGENILDIIRRSSESDEESSESDYAPL